MDHISALERYHEFKNTIDDLLASIVTGIIEPIIFKEPTQLAESLNSLQKQYPFVSLAYTLNAEGIQTSPNITNRSVQKYQADRHAKALGMDRSHRPYYISARRSLGPVVTEPYLSSESHTLCISSSMCCKSNKGDIGGFLVVDVTLVDVIGYLMGDSRRRRLHPFFSFVYGLVVTGLFIVSGILIYSAGQDIVTLLMSPSYKSLALGSFGIIIFLTLALAVFDLAKTILEEEILLRKDIFRHSSTRRTITRFIAAILIAVSIEALLLMFKSVLDDPEYLLHAVAMMATSIGLLVGLGVYVYLGAQAEAILKSRK